MSTVFDKRSAERTSGQQPPMFVRPGFWGPWWAGIWLFFLLNPLWSGWQDRGTVKGICGMAATLAFSATYMLIWFRARIDRHRLVAGPPMRKTIPYLLVLTTLAALMVVCLGEPGSASAVYLAVVYMMLLPVRVAVVAIVCLAALAVAGAALPRWGSPAGLVFGICAASLAIFGMRTVMARNISLLQAHEENTKLAVDNERNRFARDLHDILGHSLTVITVKAELAGRLMESDDPLAMDRARHEVADLERLSRDALQDVRRAVAGYRELTLPGELARARAALASAEITPVVPQSTDEVPGELRELFAWTVREGVTNVLRHSGAQRCEIVLGPSSAEVRDNGRGPCEESAIEGSGLAGLRERAAAAGAVVTTRALEPGFSLQVAVG